MATRMLLVVVLLAGLCGCSVTAKVDSRPSGSSGAVTGNHFERKAVEPPHDYIAEWKALAAKNKLYWTIRCAPWNAEGSADAFVGYASRYYSLNASAEKIYVEDGAKPYWFEVGVDQQEVAMHLIEEVTSGQEGMLPRHAPGATVETAHRHCPPSISGTPNGSVTAKRCPTCEKE